MVIVHIIMAYYAVWEIISAAPAYNLVHAGDVIWELWACNFSCSSWTFSLILNQSVMSMKHTTVVKRVMEVFLAGLIYFLCSCLSFWLEVTLQGPHYAKMCC